MALEYEHLSDPISLQMMKNCQGDMPTGEIILKKTGTVVPKSFIEYYERFRDFEVREDDTWVITFPKCGTTWVQEMVWLLKNNFDYEAAKEYIFVRFQFLERNMLHGESPHGPKYDTTSYLNQLPSPRFIKTHLPLELLPEQIWIKKPKIIYLSRDPKDAVISYFHHYTLFNNYKGTHDEFIAAFLADRVVSSPYWAHILGYSKLRHEPNILFITFEEMKQDLRSIIKRTAFFLNVNITEKEENTIITHLSFEKMKQNPAVNYENVKRNKETIQTKFIREGGSGSWKKTLTQKQIEGFERWTKKWLDGIDFDLYR